MYNIKTKGDKYLIKNNFKRKKEDISWNLKKSQIYPISLKSHFSKSNFENPNSTKILFIQIQFRKKVISKNSPPTSPEKIYCLFY